MMPSLAMFYLSFNNFSPMRFSLFACLCLFAFNALAQTDIPLNPDVRTGVLPNGLTYYILKNKKPENRAELRLVVNAGSLQENDSQQGLAHLTEHMCFNGTKNFPHADLVDFLESAGTRFGPDLNAYTSFDETVYMLQVPTDTPLLLQKGFQILEDWSHDVSFDPDEVKKERGVVVEEWRLGQGAEDRMRRKYFPVLYKGSRYANRLPIGQKDIVEQAPYDTLVQFYRDWYRPDLQAIVAVGDFDVNLIENTIKEKFGSIPKRTSTRPRLYYDVPPQPQLLVSTVTDKEAQYGRIQLQYWQPPQTNKTTSEYRDFMIDQLATTMLSNRLDELRQSADAPFTYGWTWRNTSAHTNSSFVSYSVCDPSKLQAALNALVEENERMRRFGFTETEFERAKKTILLNYEQAYNERDKTQSKSLVSELVNHYLDDEPAPGIAWEFGQAKKQLPTIRLDDVNAKARDWVTDGRNCVALVTAPEKDGVTMLSEDQIKTTYNAARTKDLKPYNDAVSSVPFFDKKLTPGKIASERKLKSVGITEWTLSNGAKVIVKPTNFKNDEVLMEAFSYGGSSLYNDRDYYDADVAADIANQSGVGAYDNVSLQKYLSDKTASLSGSIGDLSENLSGSSNLRDLETLFQLVHLSFTAPRMDSSAFAAYKNETVTFIQNRGASPRAVFSDTVQQVMSSYNFRKKPWTPETVQRLNLANASRIVKERFGDAGDFTFLFVGSFDTVKLKQFALQYLATLPSSGKTENFKDLNITAPKGKVERNVYKGSEPQSSVQMIYTGVAPYSRLNAIQAAALGQLLSIKLRETLREQMSGTYGVGCNVSLVQFPKNEFRSTVSFGSSPENAPKLIEAARQVIDSVKRGGASPKDLTKVKELMLKGRETDLKENNFWLRYIQNSVYNKMDVEDVNKFNDQVNALSSEDFKRLANLYFDDANIATFVLYPEAKR